MSKLLEQAKTAVNTLFSDTSVSREITRGELEELRDDLDNMLDSLEE